MKISKGSLEIKEKIEGFYTTEVTKSGNSARINCQKKKKKKKVIVIVLDEEVEESAKK